MSDPQLLKTLARPLFDFADRIAVAPAPNPRNLLPELQDLVHQFEDQAYLRQVSNAEIGAAKYAVLAVIDAKARRNPALPEKEWAASARASVFEGRDIDQHGLRALISKGERAGPGFDGVLVFLRECDERIETLKRSGRQKSRAGLWVGGGVLAALLIGGLGWIGWVEARFRSDLLATMPDVDAMITRSQGASIQSYAADLDTIAKAGDQIGQAAKDAPFGLINLFPFTDPAAYVNREYTRLADAYLPQMIHDVIAISLASEGDALALYDTLRANSILSGASDWQPHYIAGWLPGQERHVAGISVLTPHILALSGPNTELGDQDPELFDQARDFAAEAPEAARAYLEMTRLESVVTWPKWVPATRLPRMQTVFLRRSGAPLTEGIDGLFTPEGWDYAQSTAATEAVALTRKASEKLMKSPPAPSAASQEAVMNLLQEDTLETWKAFLSDIRIRPFSDQPSSVLISGNLGSRSSPLTALLNEVWLQTGGRDRTRSHQNQLKIAATFGSMIQFVEQGGMDNVSHLFATLNVALSALDADANIGVAKLSTVQDRANSIATLQVAPRVVVQIIEDVLAQTTISNEDVLKRQVNVLWHSSVYDECQRYLTGRFPFGPGPDADFTEFTELFRPTGTIPVFFAQNLANLMDTSESPWRWKPEARLSGISAESAGFFETALAISEAYFAGNEVANADLSFTALAQKGEAFISLGGQKSPVVTGGETVSAAWPGPLPERGIEVVFQTQEGSETLSHPGPWGLLHVIDGLRLRERDDGERFLLDVKFGGNRVFLEMGVDRPRNPISRRELLRGLECPAQL